MTEPLSYEAIDELVDTDPLALRDYAVGITHAYTLLIERCASDSAAEAGDTDG